MGICLLVLMGICLLRARVDQGSTLALRIAIILVMVFRMSRHLSYFDIGQVRSKPVFDNSKYCCRTCSSPVLVCNTYSGNDNFTTFSGVVYFAGFAFKLVDVCCIGDSLIEEFSKFDSSWTDCCNIKDNELVENAKFIFYCVKKICKVE